VAISRRSLIVSGACLIAAPAIVRVTSIMPVKVLPPDDPIDDFPRGYIHILPSGGSEVFGWVKVDWR
jgi:hypothetical protein